MRGETTKVTLLLLAVVTTIQVMLAAAWIHVDRTPPYWDEAWYLYQSAVQLESLQQGNVQAWFNAWSLLDRTRPSLVPTLVVPFFAALGVSASSGLLLNLVALAVLLLISYALGNALHSPRSGIMSAITVGSFPVLIGLTHILLVELVMVAFVAATLLALWHSNGFQRAGWAAAAGLLTGLGFLTKVFFGVFVVGPWLITLGRAWRSKPAGISLFRWHPLYHFALGWSLVALTASTWYLWNLIPLLLRSADAAVGAEAAAYGPAAPWYWRNLLAYFLSVVGTVLSPAGFLLLLAALVGLLFVYRRHRKPATASHDALWPPLLFLTSSVIPAYLVFTSIHNQDMKHVTGILPALAALIGWGLAELLGKRWAFGVVLTGIVMVSQAVLGTFPGPLQDKRFTVTVLGEPLLLFYPAQSWNVDTRYAAPDPRPWPLASVLDYAVSVGQLTRGVGALVQIGTIPDAPGLEEHALRFEASRRQVPAALRTVRHTDLKTVDVLIHKTGDWGWLARHAEIEKIMQELARPESEFHQLPRTFNLPDGGAVVLYARVPTVLDATRPEHGVFVEFEGVGRFRGYDYSVSWETLNLRCFWESLAPTEGDFSVFVHLLDPQTGTIVAQDDHLLFDRVYPTSMWQAGRLVAESRQIILPAAYTGSSLLLRVGLYQGATRLSVTSSSDAQTGLDYADIGLIRLSP